MRASIASAEQHGEKKPLFKTGQQFMAIHSIEKS